MRTALALVALLVAAPATAETFDAQAMRLCNSIDQDDCWIKGSFPLCDRQQNVCKPTEGNTPARILAKEGARYKVQTPIGSGYVSTRSIVFDGGK